MSKLAVNKLKMFASLPETFVSREGGKYTLGRSFGVMRYLPKTCENNDALIVKAKARFTFNNGARVNYKADSNVASLGKYPEYLNSTDRESKLRK